MSATTSLVQVLKDQGFAEGRVFDLRVPEQVETSNQTYIWLGRSGREGWDTMEGDDCERTTFVDVEVWGPDGVDSQSLSDDVRKFLNELPPGPFGAGRIAGVMATDQRDEYEVRNAAADDYVLNGLLSLSLHTYLES